MLKKYNPADFDHDSNLNLVQTNVMPTIFLLGRMKFLCFMSPKLSLKFFCWSRSPNLDFCDSGFLTSPFLISFALYNLM